jgi:Ni/Co efflux regulator RcnB
LEDIMKRLVYICAALACLTAAPLAVTPADAQVSVGIGQDGPTVRIGRDNDRVIDRDREHARRDSRLSRDDCREETVRTRHRDGSETVRTSRRCD